MLVKFSIIFVAGKKLIFGYNVVAPLTLSLPVTHCASHITDLTSNSNISKTVRVTIAFKEAIFQSIQ